MQASPGPHRGAGQSPLRPYPGAVRASRAPDATVSSTPVAIVRRAPVAVRRTRRSCTGKHLVAHCAGAADGFEIYRGTATSA